MVVNFMIYENLFKSQGYENGVTFICQKVPWFRKVAEEWPKWQSLGMYFVLNQVFYLLATLIAWACFQNYWANTAWLVGLYTAGAHFATGALRRAAN